MSESKPKWAGAREGIQSPTVGEILDAIAIEVDRAIAKHGPWPDSCHHGHSVLLEEVEELWAEIKADKGRLGPAKREAIQIAAVAVRYVMELCYHEQKAAPSKSLVETMAILSAQVPAANPFPTPLTSAHEAELKKLTIFGQCCECERPATEKDRLCDHCRLF